jgi:nitric oxide reductase activation protein
MGPAIRHAITKLEKQTPYEGPLPISDGRPQDSVMGRTALRRVRHPRYAHGLVEAKRKDRPRLTVDKAGHDYLKQMCDDMGYEVLADIEALPMRLPSLYRRLTR